MFTVDVKQQQQQQQQPRPSMYRFDLKFCFIALMMHFSDFICHSSCVDHSPETWHTPSYGLDHIDMTILIFSPMHGIQQILLHWFHDTLR